jgi:hypothetical protein
MATSGDESWRRFKEIVRKEKDRSEILWVFGVMDKKFTKLIEILRVYLGSMAKGEKQISA